MSVLAQAFFTLVRSHLMSLMLLSVRHNYIVLKGFLLAYLCNERLCGFECGDVVCRNDNRRVLGDIASRFLSTGLHSETTEATQIDILTVGQGILDALHKALNDTLHFNTLYASALGNFIYDFSFSHINSKLLLVKLIFEGCKIRSIFLIIKILLEFFFFFPFGITIDHI